MPTITPAIAQPGINPPGAGQPGMPPATDPLANLRDIHLPEQVSNLPLAPGWWLLAALSLAIIIGLIGWWRHTRRRNRYRREAMTLLTKIVLQEASTREACQQVNEVLKRVALHAYPSQPLAAFSGSRWLDFLNATAPKADSHSVENLLSEQIYSGQPITLQQAIQVRDFAQRWVRYHHNKYAPLAGDHPSC
jgi:hypothetical protein